ncbi:predicted protein [Coccidioides posadasii str. Silveira]|uniref:Predicted protein n=2 Tax=Coccidioides posadasii TaxID=199306 RepID=E9DCJ5_COCPS|nr:predicted protein [Coccidioides posadasii str. Silveira]KMM69231.1 hypothetical protein CPAG_05552 [Coccidioides posadasii RMSCC 3488]
MDGDFPCQDWNSRKSLSQPHGMKLRIVRERRELAHVGKWLDLPHPAPALEKKGSKRVLAGISFQRGMYQSWFFSRFSEITLEVFDDGFPLISHLILSQTTAPGNLLEFSSESLFLFWTSSVADNKH